MPMIARALLCACYSVLLSRAAAAQAATDTTRDTTRARAQGVTTSRFTVSGDRHRALAWFDPEQTLDGGQGVGRRRDDSRDGRLGGLSLGRTAAPEGPGDAGGGPGRFRL